MPNYKYPYVPKDYYPAVMFACKMIRDNGYFNKAISTAADYYGVDELELERHVRARQGAGQKGKKRGSMKWFAVIEFHGTDAGGEHRSKQFAVRGKSCSTVERRFFKQDMDYNRRNDYGGSYAPYVTHNVFGPFDTESEALEWLESEVRDG